MFWWSRCSVADLCIENFATVKIKLTKSLPCRSLSLLVIGSPKTLVESVNVIGGFVSLSM